MPSSGNEMFKVKKIKIIQEIKTVAVKIF